MMIAEVMVGHFNVDTQSKGKLWMTAIMYVEVPDDFDTWALGQKRQMLFDLWEITDCFMEGTSGDGRLRAFMPEDSLGDCGYGKVLAIYPVAHCVTAPGGIPCIESPGVSFTQSPRED